VCCGAVALEGTAGSDMPRCCRVGAETVGIVEAVVRGAGWDLTAERPMLWVAVVLLLWTVQSPASYEERSQTVHSAKPAVAVDAPIQAVVFRLVSAHCWTGHCGYRFGRAVGSLRAVEAYVPDGATSWGG
jgi:hypothetical protein